MPKSLIATPFHQVQGQVATTEVQSTYTNPTHEEINDLLETVAKEKGIPSIILKAIAFKESTWRQFDKNGQPLMNNRAIGIMQIATYNDNDQEFIEKLKTDIE